MASLTITKVNCPVNKYTIKCPYPMTPTGITIHNTANDASAMNEVSYMLSNNNYTSFHYAVDDTRAVQGINLNQNAWHAGDGANGTGNRKTIGIEICYSKSGGTKYKKALDNSLTLVAMLMKQFNFKSSQIYYHQTWSGKYCPHRTLDDGISLTKFRKLAQERYDEMYNKPKLESYKGYVTVIYTGKEGLALHNKASWADNTISSRAKEGKVLTVVGRIKVDGTYMYKLNDGQYVTSATKYVKYSEKKPTTVKTYKLVVACKIYSTSDDAKNKKNSKGKYSAGTYYIYKEVNGMINITTTKGQAGSWINPAENKESTKTLKVGSKVKIKSSAKTYATGEKIADEYKNKKYTVQQISGSKALIKELVSWVYTKDITIVG